MFLILPIKLKTSFIKSLKPGRKYIKWYICCIWNIWDNCLSLCVTMQGYLGLSSSMWMCLFLCHPSEQPHTHQHPSWKSVRESRNVRVSLKNNTGQRTWFCIHLTRQAFSSAMGAAENTYMTQKQKSQQTNKDNVKQKHSQAERQNQKWPLAHDDNR